MTIWCAFFAIYICDIKFFNCAVCFNSAIAKKGAMPFSKVMQPVLIGAYLALFKYKRFV